MKKHLTILILLTLGTVFAQNKVSYGEYWFDADLQTKNSFPLNAAINLHLEMDVPVDHLNDGLHTIHFRFKDDNNQWAGTISKFFVKRTLQGNASSILVSEYEYWFDNLLDSKTRTNIDDLSAYNLQKDLDVSSLKDGLHTVHFRFLDTKGNWSSAMSKFFIKSSINTTGIVKEITSFEYWFDNNYQARLLKPLKNASSIHLEEPLELSHMQPGLHTVHYRFKDSQNTWSSTISKFFVLKKTSGIPSASYITHVDHWFDNNIDAMISTPLTRDAEMHHKLNLDVTHLNNGLHTLHYRFADNNGLFSSAVSRFFVKRALQVNPSKQIVAYRYWLDDARIHYGNLKDSSQQLIFLDSLDLRTYSKGEYFVHVQFKDEQGLWSSAVTDTVQKLAFLYAELQANMQKSCFGDSVQFTAFVADADKIEWDLGDGTKDTSLSFSHSYASAGNYPVSIFIQDTIENIAKTVRLESGVIIHPAASVNLGDSLSLLTNESQTLDAGNSFVEYLWNDITGESTYDFSASEMGLGRHVIKLSVKDLNGCMAGDTIIINVRSGVGLQDKEALKLKVYPNPSSQFISIQWTDDQYNNANFQMIDMQGRVVLQKASVASNKPIDIQHLSSGQYLLQITLDKQVYIVPIGKI